MVKAREALDVLERFGRTWFAPVPGKYWSVIDSVLDFFEFDPRYGRDIRVALNRVVYGLVDAAHLCRIVRDAFGQPVSNCEDARAFLRRVLEDLNDDPFGFIQDADDEPF